MQPKLRAIVVSTTEAYVPFRVSFRISTCNLTVVPICRYKVLECLKQQLLKVTRVPSTSQPEHHFLL